MSEKMEIAGIWLDNLTVREALERIEGYWDNSVMNTVEAVPLELLVAAGEDEQLKRSVEALDLRIPADRELLRAAGITSPQRIRETVEHQFFTEFMRKLEQDGRSIYLVGDGVAQVDVLKDFLQEYYKRLKLMGGQALEGCGGDVDRLVNEINTLSPDVVLSVLPTPRQEYFLMENRSRMNASIWYGLGADYAREAGRSTLVRLLRGFRHRGILHRLLAKYNKNEGKDEI